MTQEELAEKLGVSRQTISKWEMDNAYPEVEKVIALSDFFNCSLDNLLRDNMDLENDAYQNIRIELVKGFRYIRYCVLSPEPEEDAITHMTNWAKSNGIANPDIVGWDFPYLSQEQINVFHMHGYCVACILPKGYESKAKDIMVQQDQRYAAITIKDPSNAPFTIIPDAYKTLNRFIEVNGLVHKYSKDTLQCYEREYEKDGTGYMDVYICIE